MFMINGISQDSLPAGDRAIQFGDGCFTTARILSGRVSLIDSHLQRLKKTCEILLIPFVFWEKLRAEMQKLAKEYADDEAVLKVIISRGVGGRGYSAVDCSHPTRILAISSYPSYYAHWRSKGIMLALSPIKLSRNPMLAGLKHLNRLEQVLISAHLKKMDADEALVLDSKEKITECCAANLFWRKGKMVFTPKLNQAGVDGVMRQFCLQKLAGSDFRVVEVSVGVETLDDAEEVVACNALLPIVPVYGYSNHRWLMGELYHFLAPLCEQTEIS